MRACIYACMRACIHTYMRGNATGLYMKPWQMPQLYMHACIRACICNPNANPHISSFSTAE